MEKLLPCPFCGVPAQARALDTGKYSVGCQNDHCYVMPDVDEVPYERLSEVIAAWNRRTPTERTG